MNYYPYGLAYRWFLKDGLRLVRKDDTLWWVLRGNYAIHRPNVSIKHSLGWLMDRYGVWRDE